MRPTLLLSCCFLLFAASARAGFVQDWLVSRNWPGAVVRVSNSTQAAVTDIAGIRRVGFAAPLVESDRFAIASCTKQMTALVAAQLVEKKRISLDLTLAEAFPEFAAEMAPGYRGVTLWMLLVHEGGVPGDDANMTPPAWRSDLAKQILTQPPQFPPGQGFHYSSRGMVILAHVLERASGYQSWESLIQNGVFNPLGMTSCQFMPDPEMWAHLRNGNGFEALPPTKPGTYLPPVMNPAAGVFCTVGDWQKFVQFELSGYQGNPTPQGVLGAASFHDIIFKKSEKDGYAFGGMNYYQDPKGREVFYHYGLDGGNTAITFLRPADGVAAVAATNVMENDWVLWENVFGFAEAAADRFSR